MEKNYFELYYRITEGLLGVITPSMRAISINVNEENIFQVKIFVETEPFIFEKGLIEQFIDHVCINIDWIKFKDYNYTFVVTNENINYEDGIGMWVYSRYEKGKE